MYSIPANTHLFTPFLFTYYIVYVHIRLYTVLRMYRWHVAIVIAALDDDVDRVFNVHALANDLVFISMWPSCMWPIDNNAIRMHINI